MADWWDRWRTVVLVAAATLLTLWVFLSVSTQRTKENARKDICERIYGAGLCTEVEGGRWVPIGSTP